MTHTETNTNNRDRKIYFLWPLAIGLLIAVVASWLPDESPEAPARVACQPLGADSLLARYRLPAAYNQRAFTRDDLYSSAQHPNLAGDVLITASDDLSRLATSIRNDTQFTEEPRLVFLYGAAGSGKSAVVRSLQGMSANVAFWDVGEFFAHVPETEFTHPDTEMEAQLKYADIVISSMPRLRDGVLGNTTDFADLLERYNEDGIVSPRQATTTIIDGLDEIHPVSATRLINAASRFVDGAGARGEPKNVVLSGRGEVFREFYRTDERSHLKFKAIHVMPLYVYDEPLRSWHAADWLWWDSGRGEEPPGDASIRNAVDGTNVLVERSPQTRHFLFTLVPANFMYDHIEYGNRRNLVALLFDSLVERNQEKHYRPAGTNAGHIWELYKSALVQVARKVSGQLDETGKFVLRDNETVCVMADDAYVAVNAAETLNLSGLIDLDPFHRSHLEYRWFPRPLLEYVARGIE